MPNFFLTNGITSSPPSEYKRISSHRIRQYYIKKKLKIKLEELDINTPLVELKDAAGIKDDSYFFVPLNQIHSNMLVLILDPQSMTGLVQYEKFSYLLNEKSSYPILQVDENLNNN